MDHREPKAPAPSTEPAPPPVPRIRVLLVDDHRILRQGLAGILRMQPDLELVGEAPDGEIALALAHRLHPDVVVMDFNMPGMSGPEATGRITQEIPGTRVVGLSALEDPESAGQMLQAGAVAFVTKGGPAESLVEAVRTAGRMRPGERTRGRVYRHDPSEEHTQIERALEIERLHLDAVLAQLPAGVLVVEAPSGRILLGNDRLEHIFRQPVGVLSRLEEYRQFQGFHPDGRPYGPEEWPLVRSIRSGEFVDGEEIDIVRGDGTRAVVSMNSAPIRDRTGSIIGGVVVDLDVTDRKRAEEERVRLQEEVLRARQRTSLAVLAGGVAHHFNNLLTSVIGNAELALQYLPPGAPMRTPLEHILASGQRAAGLSRQMLAYSGKGRFDVVPVDLNEVIREATNPVRQGLSSSAELDIRPCPDLPPIEADRDEIRQVVANLVENALEALPDGRGTIAVHTDVMHVTQDFLEDFDERGELVEGDYVLLEVRDNGSGMDAETRARIFEPFFSTKFTGRGLGLAVVLGVVRGHEGAIRVDSAPGQGASFQVLFRPMIRPGPGDAAWTASNPGRSFPG